MHVYKDKNDVLHIPLKKEKQLQSAEIIIIPIVYWQWNSKWTLAGRFTRFMWKMFAFSLKCNTLCAKL